MPPYDSASHGRQFRRFTVEERKLAGAALKHLHRATLEDNQVEIVIAHKVLNGLLNAAEINHKVKQPRVCNIPDCGRELTKGHAHGMCPKHYHRWLMDKKEKSNGNPRP
jgi:hypothetical protein